MPSRADVSTTSRTESMPARWPSTRGRWRCAAQRPLPSMMMAMWAGSCSKLTWRASASSGDPGGNPRQELLKRHADIISRRTATPTRNSPAAGAVGPARPRSRDASTSRIDSRGRRPRPISTSVPTMARTMCRRKPLPVISYTIRSPPRGRQRGCCAGIRRRGASFE